MGAPTSITTAIDRLERRAMCAGCRSVDRRAVLAEITDDGRAVVQRSNRRVVSAEFAVPELDDSPRDRLADSYGALGNRRRKLGGSMDGSVSTWLAHRTWYAIALSSESTRGACAADFFGHRLSCTATRAARDRARGQRARTWALICHSADRRRRHPMACSITSVSGATARAPESVERSLPASAAYPCFRHASVGESSGYSMAKRPTVSAGHPRL